MTNPTPFYITNAFTREPFGGNPAAVVFLQEDLPTETLLNIAKNFNQPMTTFLSASHTEAKAKTKNFRVRWFTTAVEIGLCGHATLAAAGSVFTTQDPQASIEVINFETKDGRIVSAKWVGGRVEISLPSATVEQPVHEKQEKLKAIVRRGIGKDSATVHFVGTGRKGFEEYMMVEIDETDELADCQINHAAFVSPNSDIAIATAHPEDSWKQDTI